MIARLLIYSSLDKLKEEITGTLRVNLKGYRTNHPDLLYFQAGEKLGIAEARKIKEHFSLKPYSAKGRVVVIEDASVLTIEAQNALLKTLEEPPQEAILFLGTKSDATLLPTILSRCQIIHLDATGDDTLVYHSKYAQDLEKLLKSTIEERFRYVEKLKEKEEFLHSMIYFFRQKMVEPVTHTRSDLARLKEVKFLKELLRSEEWAKQNVNLRAILEYLMLKMPEM